MTGSAPTARCRPARASTRASARKSWLNRPNRRLAWPLPLAGRRICPLATAQVLGLVVRDAPQAALLTMRVYYCAAKQDLILRSPPKAGVSKDGHEGTATKCDSPALAGEADARGSALARLSAAGGGSLHGGIRGDTPTPALPRKRERERSSCAVASSIQRYHALAPRRQGPVFCTMNTYMSQNVSG
ncbi:hypothetical protein ABIE91_001993 [Bradyrhizobium elkanii]